MQITRPPLVGAATFFWPTLFRPTFSRHPGFQGKQGGSR